MLVAGNWDKETAARADGSVLPGGAALLSSDPGSLRAWVLIDDGAVSRLGPALAWAWRAGASAVDVLVEGELASGTVARRASAFSEPPSVWTVQGRSISPAVPSPIVADPVSPPAWAVSLLTSQGVEVVMEHGLLRGEVLGLEVARLVGDHLEVGVGRHDRAARAEMRPDENVSEALAETVRVVRSLRVRDAAAHPANTLARSRWLRSVMCSAPEPFGFASLRPVAPPMPWFDLPEAGAAPCVVVSLAGAAAVVICSEGIDLDVVPTAADCWLMYGATAGVAGA
ncbi:MAG: hypothetical protein JO337_04055 [Acidimicrobiales bacterium]|nr:hypothetical protein [Acidimicrobiales bacterium]